MDKQTWNETLAQLPHPALLQTWEWGQLKAQFGWTPYTFSTHNDSGKVTAAALVLERTIDLPGMAARLRMHYVPKGPLVHADADLQAWTAILEELRAFAKKRGAFLLKIEPDALLGTGEPGTEDAREVESGATLVGMLKKQGFQFSNDQIQFRNTVFIDLNKTEEELLAAMKQKTRYNVRLAGRKGVRVRHGTQADFEMLFQMYAQTAVRDGFTIRGKDYYLALWGLFLEDGMLTPLIAEVEGEPVAGLMLFHFKDTAWYITGMSTEHHRNLMPTYLLQWEAMRAAKEKGCTRYDLWGAPYSFIESDDLWGVYRFKEGFGGTVHRHIGAWDLPLRPWIYKAYTQLLPRMLNLMRLRGDAQTRGEAGGM